MIRESWCSNFNSTLDVPVDVERREEFRREARVGWSCDARGITGEWIRGQIQGVMNEGERFERFLVKFPGDDDVWHIPLDRITFRNSMDKWFRDIFFPGELVQEYQAHRKGGRWKLVIQECLMQYENRPLSYRHPYTNFVLRFYAVATTSRDFVALCRITTQDVWSMAFIDPGTLCVWKATSVQFADVLDWTAPVHLSVDETIKYCVKYSLTVGRVKLVASEPRVCGSELRFRCDGVPLRVNIPTVLSDTATGFGLSVSIRNFQLDVTRDLTLRLAWVLRCVRG